MKKYILLLIVWIPFIGKAQVNEFGWLQGTWKMKNKETYEVWKTGNDQKILEGISYRIKGADTVVSETLKIKQQNGIFYYVPDVAGDQPEVYFKITRYDANGFTAENPEHDFPKIIRYQLQSPHSINAAIEGDGKLISFVFDRINPHR
ncbi:MAG: hypothetical protein DI538_00940 [Azospira oryzae]|jgi:hypothetical protein|nr:MAG: hypothetical protein DI538_00940 [Azospira oryzae]